MNETNDFSTGKIISYDFKVFYSGSYFAFDYSNYNLVTEFLWGILTAPRIGRIINLLSSFLHDDGFRAYLQCRRFFSVQLICRKRRTEKYEPFLWKCVAISCCF